MLPQTTLDAAPLYVRDAADPRRRERALDDLTTGFRRWRLALALARLDIRNRYRGSVLGPFWLTLSTAIMLAGLGILYSTLFRLPLVSYLPFLAVSLLVWTMINQIATEACTSLTAAEGIIRQMPLPYTVHALRCVFRNVIVAAHSLPLILVNAFAAALFLGMVCARFRDIAPIVSNAMQFFFFLSPVLWKPELLGRHQVWLPLNPFFALMETVRGPLVSGGAEAVVWIAAVCFTLLACGAALAFFARFRGRIAFWV